MCDLGQCQQDLNHGERDLAVEVRSRDPKPRSDQSPAPSVSTARASSAVASPNACVTVARSSMRRFDRLLQGDVVRPVRQRVDDDRNLRHRRPSSDVGREIRRSGRRSRAASRWQTRTGPATGAGPGRPRPSHHRLLFSSCGSSSPSFRTHGLRSTPGRPDAAQASSPPRYQTTRR